MFFYTRAFFAHVRKMKPETEMPRGPKEKTPKTERVSMSPAEKHAKLRRIARSIQQGVAYKDLRARGFSEREIAEARTMIAGK